jgi:hypothetical protein
LGKLGRAKSGSLFGLPYRDATSRVLLLTVLVIAVPILLYCGTSFRQCAYRYALDFAPVLTPAAAALPLQRAI